MGLRAGPDLLRCLHSAEIYTCIVITCKISVSVCQDLVFRHAFLVNIFLAVTIYNQSYYMAPATYSSNTTHIYGNQRKDPTKYNSATKHNFPVKIQLRIHVSTWSKTF